MASASLNIQLDSSSSVSGGGRLGNETGLTETLRSGDAVSSRRVSPRRVAISNARLVSADAKTVAFHWRDYRIKNGDRQRVMRLATDEFIRRFLIHVLPDGFHRIRHYGLLASANRKDNIAKIRTLLEVEQSNQDPQQSAEVIPLVLREPCPRCGGPMRIIEIFRRGQKPQSRAPLREQAA